MARHRVSSKAAPPERHKPSPTSVQFVVRVDPVLAAFVHREVERLGRENPGLEVTPSEIIRMALRRLRAEREGGGAA